MQRSGLCCALFPKPPRKNKLSATCAQMQTNRNALLIQQAQRYRLTFAAALQIYTTVATLTWHAGMFAGLALGVVYAVAGLNTAAELTAFVLYAERVANAGQAVFENYATLLERLGSIDKVLRCVRKLDKLLCTVCDAGAFRASATQRRSALHRAHRHASMSVGHSVSHSVTHDRKMASAAAIHARAPNTTISRARVPCRILQLDRATSQSQLAAIQPDASLWRQHIRLHNVTFSYPGRGSARPALRNVNAQVEAGTSTALVGRSGGGKSTLAQLLARVVVPNSGRITLGGVDVQSLSREWYSQFVAVVPQVRDHGTPPPPPGWLDNILESARSFELRTCPTVGSG